VVRAVLDRAGGTGVNRYECLCGWTGSSSEISITDASQERELGHGVVVVERTHRAICPQCFEIVKRTEEDQL
jgi:hypothetical protein